MSICFFSNRRRHTRWPRDWSSDVCSSDLLVADGLDELADGPLGRRRARVVRGVDHGRSQIGRASCRERVYMSEAAGALKIRIIRKGSNEMRKAEATTMVVMVSIPQ